MKRACLLEIVVGFAGKADHHIRADGRIRHGAPDALDAIGIMPRAIFAVHAAQNPVAAGLQRHMRVLADARRRRDQFDQLVGQSMGSTELMRSFSTAVRSSRRRSMSAKFMRGCRSRPHRPRLMPDSTISR